MSSATRLPREERRAQLLRVALELFAEHGYHATSIGQIIERADVARGTFYQYFRGKQEIFDQLLNQVFDQVTAKVEPIRITNAAEIAAAVRANVEALCRTLDENMPMARVLLEQAVGLNEAGREQMRAFYGRVARSHRTRPRRGPAARHRALGRSVPHPICLLGMVKEALYQQIVGTRSFDVDHVVDEIFECAQRGVLRGLAAAPSSAR